MKFTDIFPIILGLVIGIFLFLNYFLDLSFTPLVIGGLLIGWYLSRLTTLIINEKEKKE